MAALVQPFPQQSSTVTMLQTRPGSASGHFSSNNQGQQRGPQVPRNMYNGGNNVGQYRGQTAMAPVAPYAFTATPSLSNANPLRQHPTTPHLRQENRASSAPSAPQAQQASLVGQGKLAVGGNGVATGQFLKDDFPGLGSKTNAETDRPLSMLDLSLTDPRLSAGNVVKPSPDRYRRNHKRSETSQASLGSQMLSHSGTSSVTGTPAAAPIYQHISQSLSSPSFTPSAEIRPTASKDDSSIGRTSEQAKRYRRRSISTLGGDDSAVQPSKSKPQPQPAQPRSYASVVSGSYTANKQEVRPFAPAQRSQSSHVRNGSDDSLSSSRSNSRPSVSFLFCSVVAVVMAHAYARALTRISRSERPAA